MERHYKFLRKLMTSTGFCFTVTGGNVKQLLRSEYPPQKVCGFQGAGIER